MIQLQFQVQIQADCKDSCSCPADVWYLIWSTVHSFYTLFNHMYMIKSHNQIKWYTNGLSL